MHTNENAPDQGGIPKYSGSDKQNHRKSILGEQPSEVNPRIRYRYPSSETVHGRVLGALLRGERFTQHDCSIRLGSSRLSHHIYTLRGGKARNGWPIDTDEKVVTTTDAGRSATIGEYSMPPEVIAAVGERGRDYAEECLRVELEHRAIGRGK